MLSFSITHLALLVVSSSGLAARNPLLPPPWRSPNSYCCESVLLGGALWLAATLPACAAPIELTKNGNFPLLSPPSAARTPIGREQSVQELEDTRLRTCEDKGMDWEQCFWFGTGSALPSSTQPAMDSRSVQRCRPRTKPPTW
jgi:hypothetical protein